MENYSWLLLIIQAAVALGTISLAIIAIFGDKIRKWIFKPKIEIYAENKEPYVTIAKIRKDASDSSTKFTCKIKLKVSNAGNSVASNTQAIIDHTWCRRTDSETFFKSRELTPSPLTWHNDQKTFSITPQIPAYIELAEIIEFKPSSTKEDQDNGNGIVHELYLSLEEPMQEGENIKLGKGTFIIPLLLHSDDLGRPTWCYIEIFWNGTVSEPLQDSDFYLKILHNNELPKEIK